MSYASDKGYRAEHLVTLALQPYGTSVYRPRTTSARDRDTGDVVGLPLVVSVKDRHTLALSEWVDEVQRMVDRTPFDAGVVIHKRVRRGNVTDWYVSSSVGLWLPMLHAYVERQT